MTYANKTRIKKNNSAKKKYAFAYGETDKESDHCEKNN